MKVSFCLSLISNSYVKLLRGRFFNSVCICQLNRYFLLLLCLRRRKERKRWWIQLWNWWWRYMYSCMLFMIFWCLNCFSNIYLMLILLNHWDNNTKKNEDNITYNASEGMSTPPSKKMKQLVGKKKMKNRGKYS